MSINTKLIVGRVRKLIEANKLRQAVDCLCEYLSEADDSHHNEASILKRQITEVNSDFRIGIIDYDQAQRQKNKISFAILELANEICTQAKE
jgi:hypothetical protein